MENSFPRWSFAGEVTEYFGLWNKVDMVFCNKVTFVYAMKETIHEEDEISLFF